MTESYRFEWNDSKGAFDSPSNWQTMADEARKEAMLEVVTIVQHKSGLKICSSWIAVYCSLIAFCFCTALSWYLIKIGSQWGHRLLVAMPFLSFGSVVYLMLRRSKIQRINQFMENNQLMLESIVNRNKVDMIFGFWLTDQSDSETLEKDLKKLSGRDDACNKYGRQCFRRIFKKSTIDGFLEFLEKKERCLSSVRQESIYSKPSKISTQSAIILNPTPPKGAVLKAMRSLNGRGISPSKMRKFALKLN